jgi:hypothetical protein
MIYLDQLCPGKEIKMDLKNFLKNFKFSLNEQTMSMVLGAVVVVLVGGLLFNYLKTAQPSTTPEQAKISSTATESAKVTEPEVKIIKAGAQYEVKPGDSLWKIAAEQTGSGYNWVKLYGANKSVVGNNPDLIYPGQKLVLKFG